MGQRGFRAAPHHRVMCQALEDRRIDKLLVIGPPGTGKSLLLGVVYPTWRLGNEPSTTILGISAGEKLIQTFMHAAMELIQHSPQFEKLFPTVRPDVKAGWSTERGLFVTGRPIGDQDASYFAAGLKSKALTGVHAREIILDDPHDETNSMSPEGRADVVQTYYRTILGRGDPRGARFVMAGRRWATDDLYGHQINSGDWVVLHLPAERPNSRPLWFDVLVPHDIKCCFTDRLEPAKEQIPDSSYVRYKAFYAVDPAGQGFYWPDSSAKRKEYFAVKRGAPLVAETVYQGNPSAGEDKVFIESDFVPYAPPEGLERGVSAPEVQAFIHASKGSVTQAWDTAFGQSQSAALSVALTGLLVPCSSWHRGENEALWGKCDFHYDVYLLDMFAESVDFRKLIQELRNQHIKWDARPVLVEEKASGISLLQTFKGSHIPIKPQKVAEGKIARAVNGVGGGAASVQGWCRMGRVHYPAGASWVDQWKSRLLAFTGDAHGRADEFDATVHLVAWAIAKSRKTGKLPTDTGFTRSDFMPQADDRFEVLKTIGDLDRHARDTSIQEALNPFQGLCGAPCFAYGVQNGRTWCSLHNRRTSAIEGCDRWSLTTPPIREVFDGQCV